MTTAHATKKVPAHKHAAKPFLAHHKPELTREENEEAGIPQLDVDMAREALSTITADELKVIALSGVKVPSTVAAAKKVFAKYTHEQIQHLYYLGGKQSYGSDLPEELQDASMDLGGRLNHCVQMGGQNTQLAALLAALSGAAGTADKGEEPRATDADGDDESDDMENDLIDALMGKDEPESAERRVARAADEDDADQF